MHVIQRQVVVEGIVRSAVDGEDNVAEAKRLCTCFWGVGLKVFRWAEEEVEGDDDEVGTVELCDTVFRAVEVEDVEHFS